MSENILFEADEYDLVPMGWEQTKSVRKEEKSSCLDNKENLSQNEEVNDL